MTNPLLQPFQTVFETAPFEEIKLEHYQPAIEAAIAEAKIEIDEIVKNTETPNFANTIEALERSGSLMGKITSIFFNLNSAETSDDMQAIAQSVSPLITAFSTELLLNEQLFERVKFVFKSEEKTSLTDEQAYLLEKNYKSFIRNGANLKGKDRERLKELNNKLSMLSLTFSEHVLKDTNAFELLVENEADLVGLPEGAMQAAKAEAEQKGYASGWLFTIDYPSYIPFMKYAENRELRQKMYLAFGSKGFQENDNNNEDLVIEIAKLRAERAQLLGYKTHADFILEERMAEKPAKVYALWDELITYALPKAKEELAEVQALADREGGPSPLERWDFSYYSEKLQMEKFAINDEVLKPYFKLENVISGAFQTAEKLFGITFKERTDIQKYHKDVKTFEVLDAKGIHLAVFYADFFPRPSKRGGAWMTSFRGQNKYDGREQRPHVAIVCNFTKPTADKPSLLTFNEVTTLFHEFGHALHGLLANGYYESLSGTSVFWDFVELPSQLMENWCYEKACLDLFAKHFKTGETIPEDLIQKIKDGMNFLSAYQTVRQVGLGQLDMAWHDRQEIPNKSVYEVETEAGAKTALFPEEKRTITSTAFSHIFSGGYSAGYYSYKWAEVLEADAFEYFKLNGIFDQVTALKYRENILEKGGSQHPMALYKAFRGQEPDSKALLRKSGLI
ncbi:MAG: M3 family metallopeptidase [Putridiphycobacter sp.]|nr:M3 family metallopeptidase [Putridiphycobacter sp.]